MKHKYRFPHHLIGLALALIMFPGLIMVVLADDDDDDGEGVSSRLVMFEGRPAIRMEPVMLDEMRLKTVRLAEQSVQREIRTIGEVIDITPLLELRNRYLTLNSEREQAAAALELAEDSVDRLATLQKQDSNISIRELNAAKLDYRNTRIRLDALNGNLDALRGMIQQQWGGRLAQWILDMETDPLAPFSEDGGEVLIQIASPVENAPPEAIYVNNRDNRAGARQAGFLAPAARALAGRSGATYYYRADQNSLRYGMRLHVWLPDPEEAVSGYVLPRNAIVWYNGRPWFYIRKPGNHFVKQALLDYTITKQGWLVQDAELSGAEIVTQGSQLLLSEEYRWQIPDEDDDP